MILTPATLAHYLIARGLVSPASVVDGDFRVADMSRRNRNLQVLRGDEPGLFVKQVGEWDALSAETMRREATCYWLAANDPDFAALAEMMPRFHLYDPARQVLVLEMVRDGESLGEHHRRLGRFPTAVAARLGTLLGTYHRDAGGRRRELPEDGVFPRAVPWVLSIHFHNPSHFGPVSAGVRQLLDVVARYPEFAAALDELRGEWRVDALVHGDMKWENCVVPRTDDDDEAAAGLRIVDWELADLGDGCWDVGAVLQAYLTHWILTMRIPPDQAAPDGLPDAAEFPLERMHPAIGAFWSAYTATRGAAGGEAAALLHRSARYGAARMLQTAWEYLTYSPQMTPNALALLQVSINVLTRPDEAIEQLLGLETGASNPAPVSTSSSA